MRFVPGCQLPVVRSRPVRMSMLTSNRFARTAARTERAVGRRRSIMPMPEPLVDLGRKIRRLHKRLPDAARDGDGFAAPPFRLRSVLKFETAFDAFQP